jgi:thiamine pyrophosphate-dependent acetolactate synthase large subunit-like protein
MANALLHGMGSQAGFRDRPVDALAGDAGPTMLVGELATLTQMPLPFRDVGFDNPR